MLLSLLLHDKNMFVLVTVQDTIRIPPSLFAAPVQQAIHSEIDQKYPNRVLPDVGLVIARYGHCVKINHGVIVHGDGGSHHECEFRLVVFRPFVEEVLLGRISKSSAEGIRVSLRFFEDIFIPAYWMLSPSKYEENTGLWVWTPQYDDDDKEEEEEEEEGQIKPTAELSSAATTPLTARIKTEANATGLVNHNNDEGRHSNGAEEREEETRYEMELGAEIRFKVKSINFTQVTNTAKGMQATTTTTAYLNSGSKTQGKCVSNEPVRRKRSSSVGHIDENKELPVAMHIVASICEDGLGLSSWWTNSDVEEAPHEENIPTVDGYGVATAVAAKEEPYERRIL